MSQGRSRAIFLGLLALIAIAVSATGPKLAAHMRFGIEFRGGYEIYYVVSPAEGKTALTQADVLATADVLRKRADSIGMAEPDVRVEGENHIRIKLAGLTSADESRSLLGNSKGLPTILTEKYTQTVGSVLGNTALKETMTAAAIGILCVFVLLAVLYRGVGLVAAFSTVVYLWLLVALFNATHATLSLSAVVAFVLGIGMAADASIICFERLKEDLARGHDPESAIRLAFRESLPTIRDANLVTALAMIALFVAGIGPIQGFSLTMLASIVVSIATNFFLVRTLCILLVRANILPISLLIGPEKKARAETRRSINFLAGSKALAFASVLTIAAGAFYYKAHGFNLDIDFTAGTALDIDLDRSIDQDVATQIMTDAGIVPATVAIGGKNNEHIAARFDEILKPAELKKIIGAFQVKYGDHVVYEENTADPGVAREFALHAIYAVVAAFISIALYIGFRFSWSIAFATVVPIFHDIALVSAIFALFKFEIDVTYIAALLTVIGYSLNDKIVIFGRIRENAAGIGRADSAAWRALVNASITQTLGRSIYTVLTVVMASTCLYLFACEPLEMFALALIIGLLSGAYSSIFFSSLIWLRFGAPKESVERGDRSFVLGLASIALLAVFGWFIIPNTSEMLAAKSVVSNQAQTSTKGPLGDLSAFQKIAEDTRELVRAGKMKEARDRITDLETAWDEAEERLDAASPEDWTSVDKSIDRALALLRSGAPVAQDCEASLNTLIAKMSTMSGGTAAPAAVQAGPLGDLEAFKLIAVDTLKIVSDGDFSRAKERITELESAWDEAEEAMQAKSPEDWTSIDKSIDRALAKVRSGAPDRGECEGALKTLIAKMDTMNGRN